MSPLYYQFLLFINTLYDKSTGVNLISVLRNEPSFWNHLLISLTKVKEYADTSLLNQISEDNENILSELQSEDRITTEEIMTVKSFQIAILSVLLNIISQEIYMVENKILPSSDAFNDVFSKISNSNFDTWLDYFFKITNIPSSFLTIEESCNDYNIEMLRNPHNYLLSYFPDYGTEYIYNTDYCRMSFCCSNLEMLNCYYSLIDTQNMLITSWKTIIELRCIMPHSQKQTEIVFICIYIIFIVEISIIRSITTRIKVLW